MASLAGTDRARTAWRAAMLSAISTLIGMPMDLAIGEGVDGFFAAPDFAAMGIALAFLVILIVRRKRPSTALANTLFLTNAAVIIAALWVTNDSYVDSGRPWIPFEANKLGMIIVAMLASELWVGIVGIGAYAAGALAQMATFDLQAKSHFALAEPWATMAFGVFSGLLLAHHLQRISLEREVARARAEVEATQRVARIVLAVRDLSNTPLQTIAFATALAQERHPDLEPVLRSVDRSLERLKSLDEVFRRQESAIDWTSGDLSIDSPDWLRPSSDERSGRPPVTPLVTKA